MTKSYVEVAVTTYQNILVEVVHEDHLCEDEIADLAVDAVDAPIDSTFEVTGILDNKPSKDNMSIYDEFVEA